MRIIFVCLGNICRSPLAEAIARDYITKQNLDIEVDSAGTGDWHIDDAPCINSQVVAKNHNIDISNLKARQVTKNDFNNFDLVIGLDDSNIENLKKLGCKNPIKLGKYNGTNLDVPDPYFFDGFSGFEEVFNMIDGCIKGLLEDIT